MENITSGVDQSVITSMLTSGLYVKDELAGKESEIKAQEDKLLTLFKNERISFNDKGQIVVNRNKVIGSLKRKNDSAGAGLIYEIYNTKNEMVGIWYQLVSNVSFGGQKFDNVNNELLLNNGTKQTISKMQASPNMSLMIDKLAQLMVGYALDGKVLTTN